MEEGKPKIVVDFKEVEDGSLIVVNIHTDRELQILVNDELVYDE